MHFVELIQEAGPFGYLAIALGGLGVALGFFALVALLGKSPSAFTLGVATLLVGAAGAGAGLAGTFYGRSQVGGAAAFGGARLKRPTNQVQRLVDPMMSTDEGAGQSIVAVVFVGITALACAGAWVVAHAALPKLRYDFADDDAWGLASVLEEAQAHRTARTCESLADALSNFWSASDLREWPRQLRKPIPPALAAWRPEADRCIAHALEQLEAGEGGEWTQDSVLESVLLQDDALHARALAFGSMVPAGDEPKVGQGSLAKEAIAQAVRGARNQVRLCYERELTKTPSLEGKVTVEFVIGANGQVSSVKDGSETPFPSAKVTECLLGVVNKLLFPRPSGGGVVTVRYPFVFKAN